MNNAALLSLIHAVQAELAQSAPADANVQDALTRLQAFELTDASLRDVTGQVPAHAEVLDQAMACIPDDRFATLKAALIAARDHLHWRVDDGRYYAEGADVGDGYRTGNMHALLAGPQGCPIRAEDFLLGFFLLTPRRLYRDHAHAAPEIYIPLTGPSGWRFDLGSWQDHDAGTVIYNAPQKVHATRVYDVPFLALFAWMRDTGPACYVVPADDWAKVEGAL